MWNHATHHWFLSVGYNLDVQELFDHLHLACAGGDDIGLSGEQWSDSLLHPLASPGNAKEQLRGLPELHR